MLDNKLANFSAVNSENFPKNAGFSTNFGFLFAFDSEAGISMENAEFWEIFRVLRELPTFFVCF